jgi:putative flippase GtrA
MADRITGSLGSPQVEDPSEALAPVSGRPTPAWPPLRTYVPTGVGVVDQLLDLADELTAGRAGLLQRTISYLVIGGVAAVVNLVCLHLFYNVIPMPIAQTAQWVVAEALATEISIFANFIPNDRFTFSRLPGHARSWWVRCLRFHSTSAVGIVVTVLVSFTLFHWLGMPALVAQAIAIVVALCFNFTLHHVWTYRHP